ncbi:MAG: PIG-L deacetylase family protein [Blastocatellia bacterium]
MNDGDPVASFLGGITRVLILCAHTDDEFGCAGTIARLVETEIDIKYVALSRCEASVPDSYPKDILERECRQAVAMLGLKAESTEVWGYPVRHFPHHRQEILEDLILLRDRYTPDLVLLPTSLDTHQDHLTLYTEGFRAFKHSSILGYELPQNLTTFNNTAFIKLTSQQIDQKIRALSCYQSQTSRPYSSEEFIRGLAKVRGVQCRGDYAEAFEVIRLVL